MFKGERDLKFIISVIIAVVAAAVICITAISCAGGKLTFKSDYYFVCYRITDNGVSASSLSSAAASYGGAGYILNYKNNYYVTLSCYYRENEAKSVCESLKKRELECSVLEVKTENYQLKGAFANRNKALYLGNLNTLHSLSLLAYECANGLDTGDFTQSKAKDVVSSIKSGLNGLLKNNPSNCFTYPVQALIAECEDKERGFLLSKDMRYLQIAVTDILINVQLY